jgi:hypothetical protein
MMIIETKRHDPIVYRVHDFIVNHQGQTFQVEELCMKFFGKCTKSDDTAMRNIVKDIVNDRMIEKVIVSTKEGYIHPYPNQSELIDQNIEEIEKTAKALFYRRASIMHRVKNDGQYKTQHGQYDSPIFEAFERELVQEIDEELANEKPKNYSKRALIVEPEELPLIVTKGGQMSLGGF